MKQPASMEQEMQSDQDLPTKVTGFYYFDYPGPGDVPEDWAVAHTRMYVEVGGDESTIDDFYYTYSFDVYTYKHIEKFFFNQGRALAGNSILIVPTLDPAWMLTFLTENITSLSDWGTQVGA